MIDQDIKSKKQMIDRILTEYGAAIALIKAKRDEITANFRAALTKKRIEEIKKTIN